MARPIPFFFCRYKLLVDEEPLDFNGQLQALRELQGQYFAVGRLTDEAHRDSVLLRPRVIEVERTRALQWSVGKRVGVRVHVEHNPEGDSINVRLLADEGINYSDFVAIPSLGVLAVDDRTGLPHLGGKPAINRFRAIFSNLDGGAVNIALTTTPEDVQRALKLWELTEFSFVVRPVNPHAPSRLAKKLSDSYTKDGIGTVRGAAKPAAGQTMRAAEGGHIQSVVDLADAGYGQYALRGVTEGGHEAQIKRPRFDYERAKNERRQGEPRELRIVITIDTENEEAVFSNIIKTMGEFYGAD